MPGCDPRFARLFLIAMLALLGGCPKPGTPQEAELVTLAQLQEATAGMERISYLGSDPKFHYFRTNAGQFYKLERSQWQPANKEEMIYEIEGPDRLPQPGEPGFEQYVAVRKGEIVLAPLP